MQTSYTQDPAAGFPGHLGLQSMRERVEGTGGSFRVESKPGAGTSVRATVPITEPSP